MQSHKTDYSRHHQHHHHTHHNERKDESDKFRESSLRAIRRRKVLPKIIFGILATLTIIVLVIAFAVYHMD